MFGNQQSQKQLTASDKAFGTIGDRLRDLMEFVKQAA